MSMPNVQIVLIAGHDHGASEDPGCVRNVGGREYAEIVATKKAAELTCQVLREAGFDAYVLPGDVGDSTYYRMMKSFHDASKAQRIFFVHLHVDSSGNSSTGHQDRLFFHDYRSSLGRKACEAVAKTNPISPIKDYRAVVAAPKDRLESWETWKSRAYNCICGAYELPRGFAVLVEMFNVQRDEHLVYFDDLSVLAVELSSNIVDALDFLNGAS